MDATQKDRHSTELRMEKIPASAGDLRAALAMAELPTSDLDEPGRQFFRFIGDIPVGYGGFELYGEDALIRSLVVLPNARGSGCGRAIVERLMAGAYEQGARQAWLLTTSARSFFEHLDFVEAERVRAPARILATRQAASICSTAPLLSRPIPRPGH